MRQIHETLKVCALIVGLVMLGACGGGSSTGTQETDQSPAALGDAVPVVGVDPDLGTLVTVDWLNQHLEDEDLVVLDCTVKVEFNSDGSIQLVSGRADYDSGHIPGAGFADLLGGLSDADVPYKFAVPAPEKFAEVMGSLGVSDDSRVVLYDDGMSGWAARVWWMLRWIGFDRAALLDGGMTAWEAAGLAVSPEAVARSAGRLSVALRPELIADRDEVLVAVGDDSVTLVDVLPEAHFRGEMAMYDRPGHISGAINIPSMGLLGEDGRYRSNEELAAMHPSDYEGRFITYCGGGIAASSSAFAMTRLGFSNVAVYTASLQEWAADPANPMETVAAAGEE